MVINIHAKDRVQIVIELASLINIMECSLRCDKYLEGTNLFKQIHGETAEVKEDNAVDQEEVGFLIRG